MKKIFISLFFTLVVLAAHAQWGQINSITFTPSNPTTVDTVKLITNCTLGQSPCPLYFQMINGSSPNIDVVADYCQGMLTALCGTTDTFSLGLLPAGTTYVSFVIWSDLPGSGCLAFNPLDTDSVSIFVSSPTGIINDKINPLQIISAGSSTFIIKGAEKVSGNKDLILYSAEGREVFRKVLAPEENKIEPVLAPGIYFYRLSIDKKMYYGKIFSD